jgi:hypothetical protein
MFGGCRISDDQLRKRGDAARACMGQEELTVEYAEMPSRTAP